MAQRLNGRDNIDGTIPLGPWTEGVVNSLHAKSIPNSALTNAVNVDIDDKGKIKRRKGFTKVYDNVNKMSNIIAISDGILFASNGNLIYRNMGTNTNHTIDTSVGNNVCFLEQDKEVYYSSKQGSRAGIVYEDLVTTAGVSVRDFGVPIIPFIPTITLGTGTLKAGSYLISFTLQNKFMEEGPTNVATVINDIPDNSSISLDFYNSIVTQYDGTGYNINIYISEPNGEVMFKTKTGSGSSLPIGNVLINDNATKGQPLKSQLLNPFPFVSDLAYCNGRMYGVDGNIIWFSEPYRYGLVEFQSNYLIMNSAVSLLCAVQDGIYIADTITYFVTCDNMNSGSDRRVVLPYGAIPGPKCRIENDYAMAWMSNKGVVIGSNGGQVKNLQDPRFITNQFAGGGMVHRIQDGFSQIIASMYDEEDNGASCSDFADAEIRRAGTF